MFFLNLQLLKLFFYPFHCLSNITWYYQFIYFQ